MVRLLTNLLVSHDDDPRFQTESHRRRIASLYFPIVQLVRILHEASATPHPTPPMQLIDKAAPDAVPAPDRELLFIVLHVLGQADPLLVQFWFVIPALLRVAHCQTGGRTL